MALLILILIIGNLKIKKKRTITMIVIDSVNVTTNPIYGDSNTDRTNANASLLRVDWFEFVIVIVQYSYILVPYHTVTNAIPDTILVFVTYPILMLIIIIRILGCK